MATPNIKPRGDEEGQLGSATSKWLKGWFKDLFVSGDLTDGVNTVTIADLASITDTDDQTAAEVPFTPVGNTSSTDVQAAIVELQGDIDAFVDTDNQNASEVPNTPSGNLVATDVQAALNELQTEVDANTLKVSATGTELEPTDIDTLAELNTIITDATLIDTTDSRLSDARTPLSHTHISSEITDFDTEVANNTAVAANTLKVSATGSELEPTDIDTLAELNAIITDATLIDTTDSRLSDARTPTLHSSSHTNGTDDIQDATAAQKGLATAAQITKLDAITGTNTGDVTLAGTPNYITIIGQVITRALIDITSHITGVLPIANGGTGSATKDFVDLTTTQSVGGLKTFTDFVTHREGAGSGLGASNAADNFVIDSDQTNRGMSILTGAGGNSNIYFGETGNGNKAAHIQFIGSVNELRLGAMNVTNLRVDVRRTLMEVPLRLHDITTAVRDALVTPETGWHIYNTTRNTSQYYSNSRWNSIGRTVVTKAFADTGYVALENDVVICDATSGNIVINLSNATANIDATIDIKKTDSSANTVTIDANGTELIDGELTKILTTQYESLTIVCDGTNWHII